MNIISKTLVVMLLGMYTVCANPIAMKEEGAPIQKRATVTKEREYQFQDYESAIRKRKLKSYQQKPVWA